MNTRISYGKFQKYFLLILLLWCCVLGANAQTFSISGVSNTLASCGSSSVYTLSMQNVTGPANYTFLISGNAPGLYIHNTSNIIPSVSQVTISDVTHKIFEIDIPSSVIGQNVTVSFDLSAGYCNTFPDNVNQITLASAFELIDNATNPNPNVYLSALPTIIVSRGANLAYENIPSLRNQITNVADGGLVTITHKITNTSTSASFSGKVLFRQDPVQLGTAYDIRSVEFSISGSITATKINPIVNHILNQNDNTFITSNNISNAVAVSLSPGQTLDIIEKVKVNGCLDNINKLAYPQISWGCTDYDITCGTPILPVGQSLTEQISSNIGPDIDLDLSNPTEFTSDLFCTGDASNGAGRDRTARYINTGNGPANKMRFYIRSSPNAPVYIPAIPQNVYITIKRGSTSTNYDPYLGKYDLSPTATFSNVSELPSWVDPYFYTLAVSRNSGGTTVSSQFVQTVAYNYGGGLNLCNAKLSLNEIGENQNTYRFSTGCLTNGFNTTLYRGLIIDEYWDPVLQQYVHINLEPGDEIEIHWKEYNACYKEQITDGIILDGTDVKCWFDDGCGALIPIGGSLTSYAVSINQNLYATTSTTQGDRDYCLSTQDGKVERISSKLTIPDWKISNTLSFDTDDGRIKVRFFLERGLDLDKKLTKPFDFGWINKYGYKDPETFTGCSNACVGCTTDPNDPAYMYNDNTNNYYVRLKKGTVTLSPTSVVLVESSNASTIPFSTKKGDKYAAVLYEATFDLGMITSLDEENFPPNMTSPIDKLKFWLSNAFLDFDLRAYCGLDRSSFKEILYLDMDCATEGSCGIDVNPASYADNFVNMIPLSSVDGSMMINCPGCRIPGANVYENSPLTRLNLGLKDDNGDGIPDDGSTISTNYTETRLALTGDIMQSVMSITMSDGETNIASPPNFSLTKVELDNVTPNPYNLDNLYVRIDRPNGISFTSVEARIGNGSWVQMTNVENVSSFEVYNINIGTISGSTLTTFGVSNIIQLRTTIEVGNLGSESDMIEITYLGGFSPLERTSYQNFNSMLRVAGRLDIVWDASISTTEPQTYTKAQLLAVNNTFFQCTSASINFKYFPYMEGANADIYDPGGCKKVISSSIGGFTHTNNQVHAINLFDKEYRSFARVGNTSTKRQFVTEIPIPKGYTASNLSIANSNDYQQAPNRITQNYSIDNPLAMLPYVNTTFSCEIVSTSDLNFPTRLRIKYTYTTIDELSLTDKYLLTTYNRSNQNSPWPSASTSWPSVTNPILAFDEYLETNFSLTVAPIGSCSSLPANGYNIEDDNISSTMNEVTSNRLWIYSGNASAANPNENNPVGTAGNLPTRLHTQNGDIISKPNAVLVATRIDLPSQQIKGKKLELTIKMNSAHASAEYPFLYLQAGTLINQGFVLEGVYLGSKSNYTSNPKYNVIDQSGGNYLIGIDRTSSISSAPLLLEGVDYDYTMVFTYTCLAACSLEVNCGFSGTYNGCLSGSLDVSYGYNCGSFPTSIAQVGSACAYNTLSPAYTISNEPVALDIRYFKQAEQDNDFVEIEDEEIIENIKPCKDLKYRVNINSCQNGSFSEYHVKFTNLPAGFIPVSSTIIVTDNKSNQYNVTQQNGYFLIKPVNTNFSEGFVNLNVDFEFDLPCVISDDEIDLQITGVSYCGVAIVRNFSNPIQLGLYNETLDDISLYQTDITVSGTTLTVSCDLDGSGNGGSETLYENRLLVEVRNGAMLVQTNTITIPAGTSDNTPFSENITLPSGCADYTVTVIPQQGFVAACSTSTMTDCRNFLSGTPVNKNNIIVSGAITASVSTETGAAPFLCSGGVRLEANPKGSNFTYQWVDAANPSVVLGTNDYYVATQAGTYNVLVSDNANGCTSSTGSSPVTNNINVVCPTSVCPGDRPTITVSDAGSSNQAIVGGYDAQWYNTMGTTSTSDDEWASEGILTAGDYYVVAIARVTQDPEIPGCTLTTINDACPITIKPTPTPYSIQIDGSPDSDHIVFCPGSRNLIVLNTDINDSYENGHNDAADLIHVWSNGTVIANLATPLTVTHSGSFYITTTDQVSGCHVNSNELHLATPDVDIRPECGDGSTNIILRAYTNFIATGFEWKDHANTIMTETVNSVTVSTEGLYTVSTTYQGCIVNDGFYVENPLPIHNSGTSSDIPNGNFVTLSGVCPNPNIISDLSCLDHVVNNPALPGYDPLLSIGTYAINAPAEDLGAAHWNPGHWTGSGRGAIMANGSTPGSNNEFMIADGRNTPLHQILWKQEDIAIDHGYNYYFRSYIRSLDILSQYPVKEIPELHLQVLFKDGNGHNLGWRTYNQVLEGNAQNPNSWIEFGLFEVADTKTNDDRNWNGIATHMDVSIILTGGGSIGRDLGIDDVELWRIGVCDHLNEVVGDVTPCSGITIADQIICPGVTATIQINNPNSGTVTYTLQDISGTEDDVELTSTIFTVTPTVTPVHQYQVLISGDNCTTGAQFQVITNPPPQLTIAVSTTPGSCIPVYTARIDGAVNTSLTYVWKIDGTVVANEDEATFHPATLADGDEVSCEVETSFCGGTTPLVEMIVADVNTTSAPTVTTPVNYCKDATANVLTATGTGLQWYTVASGGTGSTTTPTPSTGTAGNTSYYVSQTINNCESERTQVEIVVYNLPIVRAGADQTVCSGTSVTLNGSDALSYSWNNGITNGVSFVPTATTIYTITGTDANGCTDTDEMTVTVNVLPSVSAGADQSICSGTSVTLTGSGAQSYSWDNSVTNGNSFVPTTTTTYTVTGTDGNGCVNTDEVMITVKSIPSITATTPRARCGTGTVTLEAASSAGDVKWYSALTGGTLLHTGASYEPNISTTTTYYVEAFHDGCSSNPRTAVVATVGTVTPTITNTISAARCSTGTVTLDATASAGEVKWYSTSTGGTLLHTGTSYTTPEISATTNYYVEATLNGCTTSTRTQVTATINPLPPLPGLTINTVTPCLNGTINITGSVPPPNSYSIVRPAGSVLIGGGGFNGNYGEGLYMTQSGESFYSLIATNPTTGCTNTNTITVTTGALLPSTAQAGADQLICLPATTTNLAGSSLPSGTTGAWTLFSGSGSITTPSSPTSGVTGLGGGIFRWTTTSPSCTTYDDVVIRRNVQANAGTDQTTCVTTSSVTLGATPLTYGSGIWTVSSGTATISPNNSVTATASSLGTGNITLTWTVTDGSCNSSDQMVIIRKAVPTTANAGPDKTVCNSSFNLQGNTPSVGTGTWTQLSGSGTLSIQQPTNPVSQVTGIPNNGPWNEFQWTITNAPCIASSDIVQIRRRTGQPGCSPNKIGEIEEEEIKAPIDLTEIIPNPSDDNFNLTIYSLENKEVEMIVHDVNGKMIETRKIETNKPYIFGSDYSAGVYIVKVNDEGTIKTYKVVKIK